MERCLRLILALSAIIAFIFIQEGYAIKCWDCRSDVDPRCTDPFDNRTFSMTDCSEVVSDFLVGKPTLCRKIRQKVNGVWKYHRSCAFLGEPGIGGDERFCLMRTGTYNIFMEYCTCNSKDGCNGSTTVSVSELLTIIGATVAFLLVKCFR